MSAALATSSRLAAPILPTRVADGSGSLRAAHRGEAAGFDYLRARLGRHGLQSSLSPRADFPEGSVTTPEMIARGEFATDVARRFAAFGGGLAENFTNFVALKLLGARLGPMRDALVAANAGRRMPDRPRFHFFASARAIAWDIDTSGMALVALWRNGELDRETLRSGAAEILMSAATEPVSESENRRADNGNNGELRRGVLKVYWDDHDEAFTKRRGRKHDPVVAVNALHAILLAEARAGLDLQAPVSLLEYRNDGSRSFATLTGEAIVAASLAYVQEHLRSGSYLLGTRYYDSPDVFLGFLSDLVAEYPARLAHLRAPLARALVQRDRVGTSPGRVDDADAAMNLALRLFARRRLGLGIEHRLQDRLRALQQPDGAWPAFAFFSLGSVRHFFGSRALTTVFALRALEA